jgi:hypothetical protein
MFYRLFVARTTDYSDRSAVLHVITRVSFPVFLSFYSVYDHCRIRHSNDAAVLKLVLVRLFSATVQDFYLSNLQCHSGNGDLLFLVVRHPYLSWDV